ncbi:hypothetical protein DFH09DRAFT_128852 [Mycena vulgaris]|nr:hypothetical protein DFH09DRAFT_128852 [Mycena vulgaris]
MDSALLLLASIHRIVEPTYVPSEEDVLRAHTKSTAIIERRFWMGDLSARARFLSLDVFRVACAFGERSGCGCVRERGSRKSEYLRTPARIDMSNTSDSTSGLVLGLPNINPTRLILIEPSRTSTRWRWSIPSVSVSPS